MSGGFVCWRDVDVVEADDRHVLRDPQPHLAGGAQDADRHRVGHHEHAGRLHPVLQARRIAAMPPSMLAGADDEGVRRQLDAAVGERRDVAAHAAAHDALGLERRARRRRLDADHEQVAVARAASRCSAAARAPPSSSISTNGWSGSALESTITSGRPAARICSTSG